MNDSSEPVGVRLGTATGRGVVLAAVLGSGMTMLDGTVVNVALHTVGEDLHASLAELQWVSNGYLLSLASFILLGGSLGDRFGRRRVFVVGTVWRIILQPQGIANHLLGTGGMLWLNGPKSFWALVIVQTWSSWP